MLEGRLTREQGEGDTELALMAAQPADRRRGHWTASWGAGA